MELAVQTKVNLPRRWTVLKPHAEQLRLVHSTAKFKVVPAGRRSGKTERAKRHLIKCCLRYPPGSNFFAGAPTRDQAKRIWWQDLKDMSPPALVANISESELTIWFINGTRLVIVGMDKPERIEGAPWDGGVLDEFANMKPEAWMQNVYPALADREGWCWLIGVPEGRNHYYDIHKAALAKRGDGLWDSFTWPSSDILPAHIIEEARNDLDELSFKQEYEASFVNFEGQAYYPFNDSQHCDRLRQNYNPRADLIFMLDFNVDPGTAGVAQEMVLPRRIIPTKGIIVGGRKLFKETVMDDEVIGTGIIGEVHIPRNSNTPAVCDKLIQDWGEHQGKIMVFGDATGGARGTAQTEGSDWDIVKNKLYDGFGSDRVFMKVDKGNPTERSRINAVNSRLLSQNGVVRMMVDPAHAPETVKDFEGVRLLEGGSGQIDKKHDPKLTHLTDGVGYYVARTYPLRKVTTTTRELRI